MGDLGSEAVKESKSNLGLKFVANLRSNLVLGFFSEQAPRNRESEPPENKNKV